MDIDRRIEALKKRKKNIDHCKKVWPEEFARLKSERGMSIRGFCKIYEVDNTYLSRMMSGERSPSQALFNYICESIKKELSRPVSKGVDK